MLYSLIDARRETIAALSVAIYQTAMTGDIGKAAALADYRQGMTAELHKLAEGLPVRDHDLALSPISGMEARVFDERV